MRLPQQHTQPSKSFIERHFFVISIALLVTFAALFGSEVSVLLRFDRKAIFEGEIWRIITGHIMHLSWSHLLMNLVGLSLIWILFHTRLKTTAWFTTSVFSALSISALLLLLNPGLRWYVGLSGVLHTLFIVGCLFDIKAGRKDAIFLLVAVIAKLLWEQFMGPIPGTVAMAGGNVIVDAHFYGAISGLVVYVYLNKRASKRAPPPIPTRPPRRSR